MRARTVLILAFAALLAPAQQVDSAALLTKIIARVRASDQSLAQYICRQRIVRRSWMPSRSAARPCGVSLGDGVSPHGMKLAVLDRAALDVMITRESEMFSWPGAAQFERTNPSDVLGRNGLSASGDFGSFLAEIFGRSGVIFHYDGPVAGGVVRFRYEVPQKISSFEMRGSRAAGIVGYRGAFEADPSTGDLVRLEIESVGAPAGSGFCGARDEIQYLHQQIATPLLLPEQTTTAMLSTDGYYSENHTSYEACRKFGAEATLKFDDDTAEAKPAANLPPPSPPPPGTEFDIRLTTAIDSETNWAGDRIQGTLAQPARDPATSRIVAPQGAVVRGRVTQIEHQYEPVKGVIIGVSFNAIVLNGAEVPLTLVRAEPGATGVWAFRGRKKAVLEAGFASRWRVRTKEDEFLLAPAQ